MSIIHRYPTRSIIFYTQWFCIELNMLKWSCYSEYIYYVSCCLEFNLINNTTLTKSFHTKRYRLLYLFFMTTWYMKGIKILYIKLGPLELFVFCLIEIIFKRITPYNVKINLFKWQHRIIAVCPKKKHFLRNYLFLAEPFFSFQYQYHFCQNIWPIHL